jgi:hypothetical protein
MTLNTNRFRDGDKRNIYLSPALAEQQGLVQEDLDQLLDLHSELDDLIEEWTRATNTDWQAGAAARVEEIEFKMQELWKFDKDARFHTHWLRIPGCTCPKMDNRDMAYYGRGKIISGGCPIHGSVVLNQTG